MECRRDYFTRHFTTEWADTKNVVVSLYEADDPQVQIGIIEVRIFRGESTYKGEAYIWNLWVNEGHRRKGYGRALLSDALDLAMLNGCRAVTLEWDQRNSPQWVFDWYIRQGFDECEFSDGYVMMMKDITK